MGLLDLRAESFKVERLPCRRDLKTLLLQVVVKVAPPPLLDHLGNRCFKEHLAYLAMHSTANFVVQAFLSTLSKSPQV